MNVKKYADWLGDYSPDAIIADVKPEGAIPDALRVQNHTAFLNDYLAELQDSGLKPGAVSNCIKAVKTFYHVHSVDIKLSEPLSRKAVYKDNAPQPEGLTKMLDMACVRDAFIVAAIASAGFREGTLCRLKYRHVKEDLEAGRTPIHIHVEMGITKGQYADYDTFLNAEASELLKLYLEERRHGTRYTPPEVITDNAPLIRNNRYANKICGVNEKSIRTIVHTLAVNTDISKKIADSWMYTVRTHSLRKYFRTQLSAAKIDYDIIQYMMGHVTDTYEDVKSLGIETLRSMYVAANLTIRPNTKMNRVEQLKEMIRMLGLTPEEVLNKKILESV